jgi:hypothetical protein
MEIRGPQKKSENTEQGMKVIQHLEGCKRWFDFGKILHPLLHHHSSKGMSKGNPRLKQHRCTVGATIKNSLLQK